MNRPMNRPRRHDLDNLRVFTVLLVVVYHVLYLFNSAGVISNLAVKGIPWMDIPLYFIYPWFMCLLFLVAGISASYSLERRSPGEFLRERTRRLLLPSIAGIFLLGWVPGLVTDQTVQLFAGQAVPLPVRWLVHCLMGIGPLWFLHELFLASLLLVLVRAADRNGRILGLLAKAGLPAILLLFFAVWGSSFLLNTPLITVYRNGIYLLMFFLGAFLFSQDRVQELLCRRWLPLGAAALLLGTAYTACFYGQNYASDACLTHPFTNLYLWIMILALLGGARRWLNFTTPFLEFLRSRSFGVYLLHYPVMVAAAYLLTAGAHLPMPLVYGLVLLITCAVTTLLNELVRRVPVLRLLLLGMGKPDREGRPGKRPGGQ